jgi:hypothetical protein
MDAQLENWVRTDDIRAKAHANKPVGRKQDSVALFAARIGSPKLTLAFLSSASVNCILKMLCTHGHLNLLRAVLEKLENRYDSGCIEQMLRCCLSLACAAGQTRICEYLHLRVGCLPNLMGRAIASGCLSTVKYLRKLFPLPVEEEHIHSAATLPRKKILRFFLESCECPKFRFSMMQVRLLGKDVFRLLARFQDRWESYCSWIYGCAYYGLLRFFQYQVVPYDYVPMILKLSAQRGHLHVLCWHFKKRTTPNNVWSDALLFAAQGKHTSVVEWMLTKELGLFELPSLDAQGHTAFCHTLESGTLAHSQRLLHFRPYCSNSKWKPVQDAVRFGKWQMIVPTMPENPHISLLGMLLHVALTHRLFPAARCLVENWNCFSSPTAVLQCIHLTKSLPEREYYAQKLAVLFPQDFFLWAVRKGEMHHLESVLDANNVHEATQLAFKFGQLDLLQKLLLRGGRINTAIVQCKLKKKILVFVYGTAIQTWVKMHLGHTLAALTAQFLTSWKCNVFSALSPAMSP